MTGNVGLDDCIQNVVVALLLFCVVVVVVVIVVDDKDFDGNDCKQNQKTVNFLI
jgi:hypothetical protein